MFEQATRLKLRFPHKGQVTVETLWDLGETSLKRVYKELKDALVDPIGDPILDTETKEDKITKLKMDIVKHIILTKREEAKLRRDEARRSELKQQLLEIKAKKQLDQFKNMTPEELEKEIAKL